MEFILIMNSIFVCLFVGIISYLRAKYQKDNIPIKIRIVKGILLGIKFSIFVVVYGYFYRKNTGGADLELSTLVWICVGFIVMAVFGVMPFSETADDTMDTKGLITAKERIDFWRKNKRNKVGDN